VVTLAEPRNTAVSLDDKWTVDRGRIVINGTQAIARTLLAQRELDRRRGLSTAGFITGYRGSPLGNVDMTLWSIGDRLSAAGIVFQPGVNEDIAATAVHGSQQIDAVPGARHDGVFAAWYGKGPGVDRSGDAFKHGNYAGAHAKGGVLLFYGDDHGGKSSTVAHQSEQAIAASLIPSLYPANVQEILEFGLLGFAMSRYSGSWIAMKCVNEIAEQTATIDIDLPAFDPALPAMDGVGEVSIGQGVFNPLGDESLVLDHRLPRVHAFVRGNKIDRTVFRAGKPRLGIVTAGKSYGDVRAALALLGLDETSASEAGISLYKVGCIWPLEPIGLVAFAKGHDAILVVEEKKSFLEQQIAEIIVNDPQRPMLFGKRDEEGRSLFSSNLPLEPAGIARVIAERLGRLGQAIDGAPMPSTDGAPVNADLPKRSPFFCSGCPHNRSTRVPEGSTSMTGIGCHTMAHFVRPKEALLPTQMGGEGGNWLGLAPFTDTKHIFQNMGDGTYYHSGLLAIRAAVAARVNITYKILYNDAVAMTGGQPVDGPISVAEIARQVRDEGVSKVWLLSDDPMRHRGNRELPAEVIIGHRDELDRVQRALRDMPGCTVLIYEQTCAAEKRRRRKRGTFPDPAKRQFIAKSVCEGCGDCSVQSTCVSLMPVDTAFGRKREIDQSSCNKDYSCVEGFCPSFVTIHGAEPRKPETVALGQDLFAGLPDPVPAPIAGASYNLMIAGIGGTGVVTVGALLGMAAHIEGLAMSLFDMTGLSQKNGAVFSHVRISRRPEDIHAQRLGAGEADLVMAFDLVAALSPEAATTFSIGRTRAIANAAVAPTVAFQFQRDFAADPKLLLARLRRGIAQDGLATVDASMLALAILGDTIGANLFLVGMAAQRGLLPIPIAAIERAIELNGVAISFNLRALRLGRLFAADPDRVTALVPVPERQAEEDMSLDALITHRGAHLTDYQDARLADRYRALVDRVGRREAEVAPASQALTRAVARNHARLLAYKDEYEVARLLSQPALLDEIRRTFADGGRIAFNLAPPLFAKVGLNGRPGKRELGAWMIPAMRLLARFRSIRGRWYDPFGQTAERRMERALIGDYEALVDRVLDRLHPGNLGEATTLLSLADEIRGFGPVKAAAVHSYRERLAEAEEQFSRDSRAPTRRAG
jgi:indolepyruvate ferredoxin oxidoreductase